LKAAPEPSGLLTSVDPSPVEWVNQHSQADVLLLCEHAGNAVPASLDNLGLSTDQLQEHIAWDIGAESLARRVAELLQAPLVVQRYSRLVIDCNRPPASQESIPEESDGSSVPANIDLSESDRLARESEIFIPLDHAVTDGFARHPRKAAFSVHSFTPEFQGVRRPWNAGFLNRKNNSTGEKFIQYLTQQNPDLQLAVNEPYFIEDPGDWFIPQHAEPRDLIHGLFEIRNDQLLDDDGIKMWAELLAGSITHIMEDPDVINS